MVGIYKIVSPSGKVYVGQSYNINKRIWSYRNAKCVKQIKLYNSIIKYGWEAHEFKVIHELPEDIGVEEITAFETYYWNELKEIGCEMLNIREPGNKGRCAEETKEKLRKIHKGRVRTQEEIDNHTAWAKTRRGIKLTAEELAHRKAVKKKVKYSEESKRARSEKLKGKTLEQMFNCSVEEGKKIREKRSKSLTDVHMKPVRCIETGEEFPGIKYAAKKLNIHKNSIVNYLSGYTKKLRCNLTFELTNKK